MIAKWKELTTDALTRLVVCLILLVVGFMGMLHLKSLKRPPAEVIDEERPLRVEAVRVQPEDVPVTITGYGEVRALDVVQLAPEVSGRVVEIHPRLEAGEIIPRGEVLFRIDARDYEARLKEVEAAVEQSKNSIARLKKQLEIDRERLTTLERNRELAQAEFQRVKRLFEQDEVGTRSGVEGAEQAYNNAVDAAARLAEAVTLYPIQIREAETSLASAQARLATARANLERTVVSAPFNARVKAVSIEAGQYVNPGAPVLTLADDSVLEIPVPLDSRDARQWLRFSDGQSAGGTAWFSGLEPVEVRIRWTEDREDHLWRGRLHRVVEFNEQTRTLTVAVRLPAEQARSTDPDALPLVDGMFCSVEIPGRTMRAVYALPRWAVSFENTVYVANDNRLKTLPVKVARVQGEQAFVAEGLQPGEIVITTRLADPLENSLLELAMQGDEGGQS